MCGCHVLPVPAHGRPLYSWPALLRSPSHIGLGPTLVTSFHLHHLLKAPPPNTASSEGLGAGLHVGGGDTISPRHRVLHSLPCLRGGGWPRGSRHPLGDMGQGHTSQVRPGEFKAGASHVILLRVWNGGAGAAGLPGMACTREAREVGVIMLADKLTVWKNGTHSKKRISCREPSHSH